MHATAQPDGRSPKPSSGPTSTSQLKSGVDNVHNTGTSFPSQAKGKRRERGDQGFEPIKRERSSKLDADFAQVTAERSLKSEIVKITDRGGLVDMEGVEKLVQLMLPDKGDRKIDLASRSLLASVVAASDNVDCLSQFVQLRGLSVLDEWLQEVHKGKIGDGSSSKDNDNSVEEFLFVLLRALDKLPVNLNALQMCNIGKSVNHLRLHKNLEIQKKSRSLVDRWKKRVEAEMNSHDAKSGSSQAVQWPARPRYSEVSQCGNRHMGGSSEAAVKSSLTQVPASRSSSVKAAQNEAMKSSLVPTKSMVSSASDGINSKDGQPRLAASDPPQTTGKEEKSSSSSQSLNNSQPCSSDHAKTFGYQGKEDARTSTAGSVSVNKSTSGGSRQQKSVNGYQWPSLSGTQREGVSSRNSSSLHRNPASEKTTHSGLTCEKISDVPVAEGSSHKLVVKIPNRGKNPAQRTSGGTSEDPSVMNSQASSPVTSERLEPFDCNSKEKTDSFRANMTSDVKTESWQSNDFKDVVTGSDEGDGSPAAVPDEKRCRTGDNDSKVAELPKAASSSSGSEPKSGKLHEASFNSMNALIESCVKYSETNASVSVGDDVGMNLLASVAAGEMSKPDLAVPTECHASKIPLVVDSCAGEDVKPKLSSREDPLQEEIQPNYGNENDIKNQSVTAGSSWHKDNLRDLSKHSSINSSVDGKTDCLSLERSDDHNEHKIVCANHELDDAIASASVAASASCSMEKAVNGVEGQQGHETKANVTGVDTDRTPDSKLKVSCSEEKVNLYSSVEGEKEVIKAFPCYSSFKIEGDIKNNVNEELNSGVRREQKPPTAMINTGSPEKANDELVLPSSSGKDLFTRKPDENKAENGGEVGSRGHFSQAKKQKIEQRNDASPTCKSPVVDNKDECVEENKENKEVLEHQSGGSTCQKGQLESSRPHKQSGNEVEETEECASTSADASSLSAAGGAEMDKRLAFDLNEGFNVDDGKHAEPVNLISPFLLPVSSVSSGIPASITVAAAAKGPFMPPEDLLRSKGELGWKGSAATSAFRPAEPRKILEMHLGTMGVPLPDAATGKRGRLPLDIDLNVPDERVLEEIACGNFAEETSSIPGTSSYCNMSHNFTPVRSSGGLDFDLNRVDEATDTGQCSTSNVHRLQAPFLPVKSSTSGGFPSGEVSFVGNFDLNNGPRLDEMNVDPSSFSQHARSGIPSHAPVACIRMNNAEGGNFSSLFPPGNTYSAVTIPSILPDRGDQSFPIVAAGGPPRILGPHMGGSPLGPDAYRGPVSSSSPAGSFLSTPFQYHPIFPFGTSYPMPPATFSVNSTNYVDSTSGGRLCFPAIHSQFLGPTGAVSSQFARPYIVGLPDATNNGGPESSKKWGKHGLDLNAGPGGPDLEGRDGTLPFTLRQFAVAGSQASAEEHEKMFQLANGGFLKRKEPEGGWDTERLSYKQSSWQ